ncbi:uncharacterized protein EDB93DRAFT_1092584 [Suillus bovinus]|uniref:uncharacterized protein n=1 Tax=Suillus bovinus TaxID=48563 RepID=UPI001B8681F0|nr:uncharacterized protein EDB93DRAFT_1092584 [Suillus bovinus]KAG2134922.1 hypothetical protein EDB93DRAFT_1092584 [Suillus bovinus]
MCHPGPAVGLLRAYQPTYRDHFYTTDAIEMDQAVNRLGYTREETSGYVFSTPWHSTTPLYRMYNPTVSDHFYTTSYSEVQSATAVGYNYEMIAAYVYEANICGSVAFYRLYSPSATDHFYTTSASEASNAVANLGYTLESVVGYVLPVKP